VESKTEMVWTEWEEGNGKKSRELTIRQVR